jgi:hypothetical protein
MRRTVEHQIENVETHWNGNGRLSLRRKRKSGRVGGLSASGLRHVHRYPQHCRYRAGKGYTGATADLGSVVGYLVRSLCPGRNRRKLSNSYVQPASCTQSREVGKGDGH